MNDENLKQYLEYMIKHSREETEKIKELGLMETFRYHKFDLADTYWQILEAFNKQEPAMSAGTLSRLLYHTKFVQWIAFEREVGKYFEEGNDEYRRHDESIRSMYSYQ